MTTYLRYRVTTNDPDTAVILDLEAQEDILWCAKQAVRRLDKVVVGITFVCILRY